MRLYHGSNLLISSVDLNCSKPYKDFGRGFYMTASFSRAVLMARRTTALSKTGEPQVTPLLFFPHRCPEDLRILEFKTRTPEWALFVLRNRDKTTGSEFHHEYDIVIGPVADSSVDAELMAYKEEFGADYDKKENLRVLAKRLKYPEEEYIQYCFCTEKGINQLKKD